MFDNMRPYMHQVKAVPNNQEGSSLLMSMLLMLLIAGLGFVLAAIMLREVSFSRTFDNALMSYYAAESGVERALDIVGESRDSATVGSTLSSIENYTSSAAVELSNGAEYTVDTTLTVSERDSVVSRVPVVNGSQINFYDPDNSVSATMNAESVYFQWNQADTATCTHPDPRLKVNFIEYDATTAFGQDTVVDSYVYTCSGSTADYECSAVSNVPSAGSNYIVRLQALDCTIPLVETTFYELPDALGYTGVGTQAIIPIPSVVTLGVQGDGGATRRIITAQTKWNPGATGFVDFVLFSLQEITR